MKRIILTMGLIALLVPGLAWAMTVDDVIKLSRSGVGPDVIIAQIEATHEVFDLSVQDILDLKDAGVPDDVITTMINNGKEVAPGDESGASAPDQSDQYSTDLDSRYRGDGYHDASDPNWNIYLSWGYGRYYDPWWYCGYWPSYYYYYYPVDWWWNNWYWYTPPRYYYGDYHYPRYHYRHRDYRDGRNLFDRGRERSAYDRGRLHYGTPAPGTTRSYNRGESARGRTAPGTYVAPGVGRQYRPPVIGGRGGTEGRQAPPPAMRPPGRQYRPPAVGGRGGTEGRQAPPPATAPGREYKPPVSGSDGRQAPPATAPPGGRSGSSGSSTRTMKKS